MEKSSRILVTGHDGMVGSSVIRELKKQGYTDIVSISRHKIYHNKFSYDINGDLRYEKNVKEIFENFLPEYVINAAGKVGGIVANNDKGAEFIRDNILMQTNIIHSSYIYKVKKLLFLGSSCIYPKLCQQPIKEEYFLSSELEETNIGYAIAKISGVIMCKLYNKQYNTNFISVMPTNLYGPHDNFNLKSGHVLPALLRKFHDAKLKNEKIIEMWGTGESKREFLFIDDLSNALIFLMNNYNDNNHINIGVGEDISIKDLVYKISKKLNYYPEIIWNSNYSNGTPRKLLDCTKINNLGWKYETTLDDGIDITYKWFLDNYNNIRK